MGIRTAAMVAWAAAAAAAAPAAAQDDSGLSPEERLVITRHARDKIEIMLQEFEAGPGTPRGDAARVEDVVVDDLTFSGIFRIMSVSRPAAGDTLAPVSGYEALVRGTVTVTGETITLKGALESLPDGGLIFERSYSTRPEWYREAAHRFADDIVLYLTGEKGIARTRVAFVLAREGTKEIYVVDYDGHGLRRVTGNGSINLSPAWSPGGDRLAYVSYSGGDADVHVVELESGSSRLLVGGEGVQSSPVWNPAGGTVAYSQSAAGVSGIHVCSESGGGGRRVTRGSAIDTAPSWSPDGHRIVFTSDRSGNPQLYTMNSEGGDIRRLTFEGKWNDSASWSPGGDRVAFVSREGGLFRVHEVEPSGFGGPRRLTYGPGSDETPRWAPDGRHLVFSSNREGGRGLYVLNADTGIIRPLVVGEGDAYCPAWSPAPDR
jgi:TolB protein